MIRYINISLLIIFLAFGSSCNIIKKSVKEEPEVDTRTRDLNFNRFFLEGIRQKTLGNYDEALKNYLLARRVDSLEPAVYFEIAGILNMAGDNVSALNYAKKSVELDKHNNKYYKILLSEIYKNNNLLSKAIDVYEELLNINPHNIAYYFEISELYLSIGNNRRAIRILNEAEKQFGVLDFISLEKERIYKLLGNDKKAIRELEKLSKSHPNNANYKILLAESYIRNNNIDEAKKIFEKVKHMNVENGLIYFSIADFYRIIGDYDKTFSLLKMGFAAQDVDIDMKINMMIAMVSFMNQDEYLYKNTLELMEILLAAYPKNVKVRTLYSDFLVYDEKYEEAQKELNFVLEHEKGNFTIWEQALFLDNYLEDWDSMYQRSKKAIDYFPNQRILYLFFVLSSYLTDNFDDAIRGAKSAKQIIIDDDDMMVQILTFKAESYRKLENHEKSDEIFEKVLSIDSQYTMVLNNYSYYLALREENLDKAIEMSTKLMTLDTTNAAYLDTHAWVLYKHGRYEEALEYINKAVLKSADSPIHLEHKGDILYKLKRKEEALRYWEKAKKAGEGSDLLEEKIINKTLIE